MGFDIDYNRVGPFRQRLCVDCYGVDPVLLGKIDLLHEFMEYLTKAIGMRVLVPPIVVRVPVVNAHESIYTEIDCGLSGTVVYLESSCSVHTQPELQFISVDIYTCKEFDVNDAIDTIKQFYSPIEMILTVNSKKKGAEP